MFENIKSIQKKHIEISTKNSIGIFIPARTTSNRLPNKLLLPFGDSSLFEIACQKIASLPNKYGKYALVYEDELIEIALKHGLKILLRDKETIYIDGPIVKVMGAVSQASETHLMFLNPCLAFFTADMILESLITFENLLDNGIEYATSVKSFKNWLFNNQNNKPITPIDYFELNTKNISGMSQAAHCFHIFNKQEFIESGQMLREGHGLIQVPDIATIDVDTFEEYEFARWKYERL